MWIEPIGFVTCLIGLASLRLGLRFGLPAFMAVMLLQSAAALLLPGVGNIQPAYLLLGFMAVVALRTPAWRQHVLGVLRPPEPGFWLACTCLYGIGSAYFLPRLFAGTVLVNAASASDQMFGSISVPLRPFNGNITQSVYLLGDLLCYLVISGIARSRANQTGLARALMVFCALDIVFALADIVTTDLGLAFLLDPIRNSTYSILSDLSVGGLMRIIGSFPEASSFAAATVSVFCVAMRFWLGRLFGLWSLLVAASAFVLLIFATSTTGYVALSPCLLMLYGGAVLRLLRRTAGRADLVFLLAAPLLAGTALVALLMQPALLATVVDFVNQSVLDKGTSQSGIERGMWNAQAFQNLVDTHGIGVGLGSARASSIVLAALSNLGVVGALLYLCFFVTVLARPGPVEDHNEAVLRDAARLGAAAALVSLTLSGALVEPGLWLTSFAAVAGTRPARATRPGRIAPQAASAFPWPSPSSSAEPVAS